MLRSLEVRMRAELSSFKREFISGADVVEKSAERSKRAIRELDTAVERNTARIQQQRQAYDRAGTTFLRTGAALTATTALVVKAAMDWESAWTGVLKTVDGTPQQLAAVEQGLRGLVKTMPQSHREIAATAEAAGQLGVKTKDIVAFTRVMTMLGDTTNLTADEAATSIAQLMNVMQTAPENVDRVGATLVELGNNGASTERDIVQMAQRIAGAGEIIGLSEANVLSLANALASSGIEVEAGGSAISNVLIDVAKAVKTNSGELETWAKVAGTSADEFAAKFEADPASALADFTEGLGRMASEGGNVFGVLDELGQSDVRVTRALLNMANAGTLLRDSLSQGDLAWQQNTALVEEAEKRYDTAAAKSEIAWNGIKDNAIDAGQAMLPVVAEIAGGVASLTGAFGSLPGPVKGGLGALAGVGGVSLLAVGGLMKATSAALDMRSALTDLELRAPKTGRALTLLSKGFAAVAIAATAGSVLEEWDTLKVEGVNEFTKGLLEAADGSDKLIQSLASADATGLRIGSWGSNEVNGLADAFDRLEAAGGDSSDWSFGSDSALNRSGRMIEQIDAGLASLVASGSADRAAEALKYLGEETQWTERRLVELLPAYKDALAGAESEASEAAQANDKFTESNRGLAMVLASLSSDTEEAQEQLQAMKDSAVEAANGIVAANVEIDKDTSLQSYIDQLAKAQEAQEKFTTNLLRAKQRGASDAVLEEIMAQGPAAAQILDDLANGSKDDLIELNNLFADGAASSNDFANALREVPAEVITQFSAKGGPEAAENAADLADEYGIMPDVVETILQALDWSSEDIKRVLRLMNDADNATANPRINAETDAAKTDIQNVLSALKSVQGTWVTNLLVRKNTVTSGDDAGNNARAPKIPKLGPSLTLDADGGFHQAGTRAFAGGGFDERGRYVSREPQMRSGAQGRVMWGEAETGWEAYISGKPGKEGRNQAIWLEAGRRLGMVDMSAAGMPLTAFADGGFNEAVTGLELTQMRIRVRDLRRSLRETEKYKPKSGGPERTRKVLRGLDRIAAVQELAEARRDLRSAEQGTAAARRRGMSASRYNEYRQNQIDTREQRAEDTREKKKRDLEELRSAKASIGDDIRGRADIGQPTSASSVLRGLRQSVASSAELMQVLIALKKKGAAPWLLEQLYAAGPSKGTIRAAREFLADSSKLREANSLVGQLDSVAGIGGRVMADPKWSKPGAWNANVAGTQAALNSVLTTKNYFQLDGDYMSREVVRLVTHVLSSQQGGAVLPTS